MDKPEVFKMMRTSAVAGSGKDYEIGHAVQWADGLVTIRMKGFGDKFSGDAFEVSDYMGLVRLLGRLGAELLVT